MAASIKLVVVGDHDADKTALLITYTSGAYPGLYIPTVFDDIGVELEVRGELYTLKLYDTAGQEDYVRLRPLSYPQTDVFLVCFSVASPSSFENVRNKWVPEITRYCPKTPFLLVGTNTDLRDDPSTLAELTISTDEGVALARDIHAMKYVECSARTMNGVKNVFEEAAMTAVVPFPFHLAAKEGHVDQIVSLLQSGGNVNCKDYAGKTPLQAAFASYKKHNKNDLLATMVILLGAGAHLDVSMKEMLKKMGKVGNFIRKQDGVMNTTELSEDIDGDDGTELSVVILNDNKAIQLLNESFKLQHKTITNLFLFNVDIANLVVKLKVSHRLDIMSVGSFEPNVVSEWLLPSVKFIHCINTKILSPWHINFSGSLDILDISHCIFAKNNKQTTSTRKGPTNSIKITGCKCLKQLRLNYNGLDNLQEDIGEIPGLEVVDIRYNSIQRIPPSLSCVEEFKEFRIKGNPILNVPADVIAKGTKSILSYLKEFLDPDTLRNDNVKVVLVGHERVGKSTLVNALRSEATIVEKTDGIEILEIVIDKGNLKLTIFDFAGDVDFLESHSLFITDDSVYLVVFDLSQMAPGAVSNRASCMHQVGRVKLWLLSIYSLAPNSRAILVGTHADKAMLNEEVLQQIWMQFNSMFDEIRETHQQHYSDHLLTDCLVCHAASKLVRKSKFQGLAGFVEIESEELELEVTSATDGDSAAVACFPHILGYYEVGSTETFPKGLFVRRNRSVKQLKAALQRVARETLLSSYPGIPKKWSLLIEELTKTRRSCRNPIIEYAEYEGIAAKIGIVNGNALANVTSFLCSQGDIVLDQVSSAGSGISKVVVLDPQWLANILSTLITYERDGEREIEYINSNGVLDSINLAKAWEDLDTKYHNSLMAVFIALRVCFSLTNITEPMSDQEVATQCYLFPCKLPVGKPSVDDWYPCPKPDERQASHCYRFGFMPPLFFCDLIVAIQTKVKFVVGDTPLYTRNNLVYRCNSDIDPCSKCTDIATSVMHIVRFELLYHNNSILVHARGPQACCLLESLGRIMQEVHDSPFYRHIGIEKPKGLACPHCILKYGYHIGEMIESGTSYLCPLSKGHNFDNWNNLLLWKGVDRQDISKVIHDVLDDRCCPSYFVILPINTGSLSVVEYWTQFVLSHFADGYAVHLLCEFPQHYHFIDSPGYRVRNVKNFVKKYGPHLCRVLKLIHKLGGLSKLIADPNVRSVTTQVCDKAGTASDLLTEFMHDFQNDFPELSRVHTESMAASLEELEKAKYSLNRHEFQRFLCKADEGRRFGDLYPVHHGNGVIWVCREHALTLQTYKLT
ncbi:uncharacterized protein LOC144434207 [Glandiceps talaboti]